MSPSEDPRTVMRRRDRSMDDEWIEAFLTEALWGFLATSVDDQPFLNSNLFVYDADEGALWLHTARTGRMPDNVAANPRVVFSTGTMGRLLPADEALEFSVEYASVVVFGRASVVTDPERAERALQLLLDKYAPHLRPGRDYRPITGGELTRTAVYRVEIESWSGKQKVEAPDFEGAFRLDEPELPFGAGDRPDG